VISQRTIEKETSLEGIGLHTGSKIRLNFKPAGPDEGIKFKRTDLSPNRIIDLRDFQFGSHKRRTTISKDGIEIHTVEHLMAALWANSIDNILIEIDGIELPGLDGSARDFFICLKSAGIKQQNATRKIIKIKEPLWCEKEDSFIGIFPRPVRNEVNGTNPKFKISYILESPSPSIGRQSLSIELDQETFFEEIAPARTFCLKEEAELLLTQGFGKGANLSNTLVMDEKGPVNNVLRFPDEPVRHKILDLIGDLYLAGNALEGRVIAIRSGHELNMELVKKIKRSI
jgi:UDP-3-O-acyl N-acetylglucosamine deacetylase